MEKQQTTPENVPYIVYEAEIARQERYVKRLWISLVMAICACVAVAGGFLLYLNQYDFTSYEQDGQGVNIIGNMNGVDYDVTAREDANQEKPFDGEGQGDPQAP